MFLVLAVEFETQLRVTTVVEYFYDMTLTTTDNLIVDDNIDALVPYRSQ